MPSALRLLSLLVCSALIVLLASASLAHAAAPVPVRSAGCAAPTLRAGNQTVQVTVGGLVRTAYVHVPKRAIRRPAAAVLTFHGAHGTGPAMAASSGLLSVSDRAGFIAVFPTAAGANRVWNAYGAVPAGAADDVAFVQALLAQIEASTCVDLSRVSVAGLSVGGGFAARLACDLSAQLAGAVVVAGALAGLTTCATGNPVSILEIHGTNDPTAHYWGRNGVGGVLVWLARWLARDDCQPSVKVATVAAGVQRLTWARCEDRTVVQHLIVAGGRHQWPGADPPDPGPAAAISAAQQTWAFLAPRRLAVSPDVR